MGFHVRHYPAGTALVLVVTMSIGAGADAQETAGQTNVSLATITKVHSQASSAVIEGKALTERAPTDLTREYASAFGEKATETRKGTTYGEILKVTETHLGRSYSVTVKVEAAPDGCSVKYRAIAGGGTLDFGTTPAARDVDPKTYQFICECRASMLLKKTVECTSDTRVLFECERE